MKEAVEKLLKKMGEDKAFAENILRQKKIEKVIELAGAEGIELTPEDIDEANEIIRKVIELQQTEGELSEEELEQVAGGTVLSAYILGFVGMGLLSALSSATIAAISVSSVIATVTITENV